MFDLVIRNGMVVDGSGGAPTRADLGVVGDRIVEIGRVEDRGREEIDAEGHVVTPGFVDGHAHMDAQVFWDDRGTSSCWHGITTVVMGNCGFTLAPARPDERNLVVRNLERAEDIPPEAMAEGIEWTWETFREYLDAVERCPKGINYAAQVGHSALRTYAMGERAFEAQAGDDDLAVMQGELLDALDAGAVGFTTSRHDAHRTADDRPVASRLAAWDEVRRLVLTMGTSKGAIFQLTQENAAMSPDPAEREDPHARLHALCVESGVPITFGVGGTPAPQLELIDRTVAAGGRMFGQTHSRGVSTVFSFRTRLPFDRLPEWQQVRARPVSEQLAAFRDPAARARLVAAAHRGDFGEAVGAEPRNPDYELMYVLDRAVPPHHSVADVAAARQVDPVELILDLAIESEFDQLFAQPIQKYVDHDLLEAMKHPRTVMTFSDTGAHVSQIVDCSIQTHLLAHWVRNRQAFTLEEAVHMLTFVPASAWGFSGRGLVREGWIADLNVFDPERVGPELPIVTADLPGGATRLVQRASGFRATVVGGEVVIRDGVHTGHRPGRLLRRDAAS